MANHIKVYFKNPAELKACKDFIKKRGQYSQSNYFRDLYNQDKRKHER